MEALTALPDRPRRVDAAPLPDGGRSRPGSANRPHPLLEHNAVKVLDRKGLAAFERAARSMPMEGKAEWYVRRRRAELLKAIYEKRKDVEAYRVLCEEEGGLSPKDCETLARMCLKRKKPDDALSWCERGLALAKDERSANRSAWGLPELHREVLLKLGRGDEALDLAWKAYRDRPSAFTYKDLMRLVPRDRRDECRQKALEASETADLSERIGLLVTMSEWDRLADLLARTPRRRLVNTSHYTLAPVAARLRKSHPRISAELHIAMALRVVEAKKSKYYHAALENLETARALLLSNGHESIWDALVAKIREKHRRKYGFMPGFEKVVAGTTGKAPAFCERARKRWERTAGRERRENS